MMTPLNAFQVLVLAMAAAMAIEALKPSHAPRTRVIFWVLFVALSLMGIATNHIATAWPAASAIMVWVGSSPITVFLLLMVWLLWIQKPWSRAAVRAAIATPVATEPGSDDAGQRLARLEHNHGNLRDKFLTAEAAHTEKLRAIIDDYERMSAVETRAAEALGEARDKIAVITATHAAEIAGLKAQVEHLEQKYIAHHSLNADNLRQRFDSIYNSLLAIYYREQMLKLADKIDDTDEMLAVLLKEGRVVGFEEWQAWQAAEQNWRRDIDEWCSYARFYVPDVKEQIERQDSTIIEKGSWAFREEQLPTHEGDPFLRSNAVLRYKAQRMTSGNWSNVKSAAHDVVRKVAFEGLMPQHWSENGNARQS